MEHRRPADEAPGTAGDTRVAGTAPQSPVVEARPTAPQRRAASPSPAASPPPAAAPTPAPASASGPAPASGSAETRARLLDPAEAERFRARWHEVQAAFVDDPGEAVRRADDLASDAVDALGRAIAAHRRTLTEGRDDQGKPDTERLRLALHGYRDLLNQVIEA
ncbi:hypothetical protein [Actinomadura chibensis]|uniref:Uncharacterized protein n=1 Tax=Actinomadura chibensis TaxID=392828 RepID=A0A5D0NUH2_9ACTN|nr:hypothetical protein [Actinomadura chibensis]TYB47892.1 hypothetical protein FXF69_01195 [Actinomadura chibensis]